MGIGKIIDNDTFYEGYEGEPQIVLSLADMEVLHIWEGYFEDIYGAPALDGKGWNGFTRDYAYFANKKELFAPLYGRKAIRVR